MDEMTTSSKKIKIPGMLYILFSFVPWIIYWVLSGMGNSTGIIIALAIIVILLVPQVRSRDFNLMDIFSLLYFIAATVGTFIFGLSIFVERSGILGYGVLFVMAVFSLIIKQPYTLQVAKRDYPEIYWKDKSFITINTIITVAWVGIFLVNVIVFWLLTEPLTVVVSILLIVLGIIFSIVFPVRAPAYLQTKKYKKFDWSIDVDPQRLKGENEYDVIIVGSGIGGLSCGALLCKRGYKVLALEQHYQVGGYCSSFKRKGFVFNTGVENVSGLWEKGPITFLLKELGLNKDDLFVRNTTRYIFKGKEINMPDNLVDIVKLLSEMFPDGKENIPSFFDEAKKAFEQGYKNAHIYGTPLPDELIVKVLGSRKYLDFPKEAPHFYDWMNKTYKQKLDEYFEDEDLKTLFCALLGHAGTKLEKTPGLVALTRCLYYYIYGGHFTKGGAQKFANCLKEYIEAHGGEVLLRRKVDEILTENKKVRGVRVGDEIFTSPVVASDADAKATFLELVGEDDLDKEFAEHIEGLKMSPSCFMVFLGVDMELSNYPTLIKIPDEGYAVVINSNADPSLAPKGKASITILKLADYRDFPERGTKGYSQKKKGLAEMLIQKAETAIPHLSKHIIVQDAATPKTLERYTSVSEGALYSFDQSGDTERPYFRTPIKGLYLAGASTFPGGGIESVVISGIICSNDICAWKFKAPQINSLV